MTSSNFAGCSTGYLGWQESLALLAYLVEPDIPDGPQPGPDAAAAVCKQPSAAAATRVAKALS
jgi:hypothetical protein